MNTAIKHAFRKFVLDVLEGVIKLLSDDEFRSTRECKHLSLYQKAANEFTESKYFSIYLMIDEEKEIIGGFEIKFLPHLSFQGSQRAQVESVRIRSDLRGRGLAKKLISFAIDLAKENNCGIFQLTSNKSRMEQSHKFYESLGLKATHEGGQRKINQEFQRANQKRSAPRRVQIKTCMRCFWNFLTHL